MPAHIPIAAIPDIDVRQEWEHFREFGWSDERIARRLNVEMHRALEWARIYGRRGRPVRPSAGKRRARVAELINQGISPKDVAAALGISRHTVHDDCFRLGITRRTA
ncbi:MULTISPECIES: helix-turn-helix domain-containing protein [Mycobacterium avium complex (MAC)]|uniref:Helix-turn-helix domain-containing protein n=1 Tax=Mycobacterium intracellulare subsp. chimaera TaxID=222805 RepID=A0ABT7P447_MYCIT|nr:MULTISPECIES: helix-turn-helix domain-containing protein [Mycobacterium avium complex (MAC)]APD84553.1 hypothetical protein AN480_29785 [Mycobacterium intracellulare subsp. chimaera]MDM3927833.1 helix-turn-helix domain-containing protein [Mycobacterium intracellulare subsp. chimaera]PBA69140.1 hypothetical protein CKJ76_24255 [Mycobacterium avium]